MKIFITGQCTLHWGRMEFGNIGNYYIMEPFIRQIHKTFSGAEIRTTFQMSERFCKDEDITVVPMNLYYGWNNDFELAEKELQIADVFIKTGKLETKTPYIEEVINADLVIDFSGDIWGDNADFLGPNRFYIGLCKDRVAQIFAKKTVMLAGSPGPFSNNNTIEFAKEVYSKFDLVTNRESISTSLLKTQGFDISKTYSLSCPAFLFEPATIDQIFKLDEIKKIINNKRPKVGFIICGWNFLTGPFDKWPRDDSDYLVFVDAIEQFTSQYDADIYLISHSNGFPIPPAPFELKHGRDYPITKQLQKEILNRNKVKNVYAIDGVYDAWQTKKILSLFDMVVSGRIHAAVAALSQNIPTVIINYGHEPKAHKLRGFAEVVGALDYFAEPDIADDLNQKMIKCWKFRDNYKIELKKKIPDVLDLARNNFELLKNLI